MQKSFDLSRSIDVREMSRVRLASFFLLFAFYQRRDPSVSKKKKKSSSSSLFVHSSVTLVSREHRRYSANDNSRRGRRCKSTTKGEFTSSRRIKRRDGSMTHAENPDDYAATAAIPAGGRRPCNVICLLVRDESHPGERRIWGGRANRT